MENNCDIILTYCWNRVGYTILRTLSEKGLKVWAADTSKRNICSMSKFCTGSFTYPDPFTEEEAFICVLKEKVAELKPRVLMPTHDESVVIMRHREEFPKELVIPYESEEMLLNLEEDGLNMLGLWVQGTPDQVIALLDEELVRSVRNYDARIQLWT